MDGDHPLRSLDDASLDVIKRRCEADLLTPDAFEGSGALVTWRRVCAVQMTRRGSPTAEIAATTGLPPDRVRAVVDNCRSAGVAALYPSFPEDYPASLSRLQRAEIGDIVRIAPGLQRLLTITAVVDRAVRAGSVPDLSERTAQSAMRRPIRAPGTWSRSQLAGYSSAPNWLAKRPAGLPEILLGILPLAWTTPFIVIITFILLRSFGSSDAPWWFELVVLAPFVSIYAIICASAVIRVRAGLRRRRLVRPTRPYEPGELERADQLLAVELVPRTDRNPSVTVRNALTIPEAADHADGPAETLYLWPFSAAHTLQGLLTDGWLDLAPTRLLATTSVLTSEQLETLEAGEPRGIVDDADSLEHAITSLRVDRGKHRAGVAPGMAGLMPSMRYRGYPLSSLVCSDDWWQSCFDRLLQRAGLVVVNLSGFTADHPGLAHELVHVLTPPSPAPEVFLIDSVTDADAAIDFVVQAWRAADAHDRLVFIRVPVPARRPPRRPSVADWRRGLLSRHADVAGTHLAHSVWSAVGT